jgi:uncharacterized protein YjiS (DUF1127 family)
MTAHVINPARLLARLRARLEERRRYWATVHELEMLNDRDLADIGLTRRDIRRRAAEL